MNHPIFADGPYQGYAYAYPHKTAYRPLPRLPLGEVWAEEPQSALFLYAHIPFCTMRCGFCNLFTSPNPSDSWVPLYLDAFRRQAEAVRSALPEAKFARFAIGGGTPTYLDVNGLNEVFDIAKRVMGVELGKTPIGIETSPDTVDAEKVALLRERNVDRVSIGVQSFVEAETANAGRPQTRPQVEATLELLARAQFPTFNIDLIYGLPGQTVATWLDSLKRALVYDPEELYLYPLYVRPLTGLGRSRKSWDDERLACYRAGRDLLLALGYEQASMRMFRKKSAVAENGPIYCCQDDGMIGLGSGARSYTRSLHYSLEYAVEPKGVKGIIADYLARDAAEYTVAEHGYELDGGERRRRFLLQSLLRTEGLDASAYRERFGVDPARDFPELETFAELGMFGYDSDRWFPTATGLEWSDALGPWFYSPRVRELMGEYEPK